MAAMRRLPGHRRVTVLARIVRHRGVHFRAAPLARHIAYLERDGVTRDGKDACMFGAGDDETDGHAIAARCEDDRHHFRFIVSPEDAGDLEDLRRLTRGLMDDMARDLETRLDWVAVDHWNTDNPHIHILVRGVADDGSDLVIDRGYISEGMRHRAEARVTLELGPRSEQDIAKAMKREVDAERWTGLDRRIRQMTAETDGLLDLRPTGGQDAGMQRLLRGRAARLEALGLATREGPAIWTIAADAEGALRDLSVRGDIIKTIHHALAREGQSLHSEQLLIHSAATSGPVIGRLVDRGLHDELEGSGYAIVEGSDGRTHHLIFPDLELAGDAPRGAIVELRRWDSGKGVRQSLATRSDLSLAAQATADGATWLDRQLVAREPIAATGAFGRKLTAALVERSAHLASQGLASRQGEGFRFARDLLARLRARELETTRHSIEARTGLTHRPSGPGDPVIGVYRERIALASGRFAMIDDGVGFQLVPWRPALDAQLGRPLVGTMGPGGTVDWSLGRGRGLSL